MKSESGVFVLTPSPTDDNAPRTGEHGRRELDVSFLPTFTD
jgi:hypothetical protein